MGGELYDETIMGLEARGRKTGKAEPFWDPGPLFDTREKPGPPARPAPLPLGFSSEGAVFRQAMVDGAVQATRGWPL
jgi:hypothetical protein